MKWRAAGRWWHPGWSWTIRHPEIVSGGYFTGTLVGGAALAAIIQALVGGLSPVQQDNLTWIIPLLAGVTAIALAVSGVASWGRRTMLRQNGTAYLITEQARDWDASDDRRFLADVRSRFARVIEVPGPGRIGRGWDWPVDEQASRWDSKVTELARAFRVLSLEDRVADPGVPDGVFIWAWWPVTLAFGARVSAADRGLELSVWQRPSFGRAGEVRPRIWAQGPHRFTATAAGIPPAAGVITEEITWKLECTVTSGAGGMASRGGPAVAVLLLRFGRQPWGPLPRLAGTVGAGKPLPLELRDAAQVAPEGTGKVKIHELRCLPSPSSSAGGAGQFGWDEFPFLAATAFSWVQRKAAELADHTLLLGAVLPNEVALGIGILAGNPDCRDTWPEHLWPVAYHKSGAPFVVPCLDLGTAAFTE